MIYSEGKQFIEIFFLSTAGFVEINPEKCIVLAEGVFEMNSLNKNEIEKQVQELKNENNDELKQQYLIAKSKMEALNSSHYEKI